MRMSFHFEFDEAFEDLRKMMHKLLNLEEIEETLRSGELKGNWDIKEIGELGVKGYIISGRLDSSQLPDQIEPFEPEPFQPLIRQKRPLLPERLENIKEEIGESDEPLVDIVENVDEVKVYVELSPENMKTAQLNITEGELEIKTSSLHKVIEVPTNLEIEKASSKHRNTVLEITIPRKKQVENRGTKITTD